MTATLLRVEEVSIPGPRWGLARVRGESMAPTLRPGDRLLIDHRRPVTPGAVVTARFPDGTLVVKRAVEAVEVRGRAGWFLRSDNPEAPHAVDSRHRGPVRAEEVTGVVRLRLWPRPGRIRTRV